MTADAPARSFRPKRSRPLPPPAAWVSAAVYAFLYAPLAVLVAFSFNRARLAARWEGFTLAWYVVALHDHHVLSALRNSLLVAVATTALATSAGTAAALAFRRYLLRAPPSW